LHTDGTNRRQTAFQNFVQRILLEGGSRHITLSSCILAEDKSAVSIAAAVLKEFKHSGELLTEWREVTAKLYPSCPDLLEKILKALQLSISKLGFGSFTTTNTCLTAGKLRRVLNNHIKRVAKEEGFPAMLRCTDVAALLRILSILHISICLPTCWLAGKSHELSEFNFGYYDMGKALDLMERAFESIIDNRELMLNEDFMMNKLFSDIAKTAVNPFKTYLEYMFEENLGNNGLSGNKVLPWDLL
jgi:hypothetical protein